MPYNPGEFKVRQAQGQPDSPVMPRPLRKGVVDLQRLARTGKACTHRYLNALATVRGDTPLGRIMEPLTKPTELSGHRVRGLRPWAASDLALIEAIGRGEFIANGLRNRDLIPLLHLQLERIGSSTRATPRRQRADQRDRGSISRHS